MDHRPNCFELFGLDFVIDEQLKCWLIEANMSPACAQRKGQKWLFDLTENMADGMLNMIEYKVLQNMASQNLDFKGPIEDKIKSIKNGTYKLDLKNWEQVRIRQSYKSKAKEKQLMNKTMLNFKL